MRSRPPLHLLLTTLAALILCGNANAEGDVTDSVASPFSVLTNSTISCSAAWPSTTVGCWWEIPLIVLGPVEASIALDFQAALRGGESYLAPMFSLAWYGEAASVWLEVALPPDTVPGLPLGKSEWARVGFSYRWTPR